ncbi:LysR family transcriptional regulator [Mammaliicoccus sciuri]|uniref:helix-turn-helix domain-containing protein n=1 Tax=Mammaliicoccus sciuri TaxID=1296 RepID=UPI001E34A2D5|nr:LysR family transcriptional regulator [Mammaliicoccus sciuri]MCD8894752.1 LysR family transcriptional regulator [Mammaliicoccus sciuri]MCD8912941.1 LysR family transcriptional regulator [Mammaliicoccus sciuri]
MNEYKAVENFKDTYRNEELYKNSGYTQSNVSQQINQLEAELKNELFIYSNRKLIESEFLLKILP